MDLTWTVEREGDASLVRCRVRNDDRVPRRVRLDSRLDGPVLPPRRGGVPEAGWDAAGVVVRLAPDETRAVGFAVPADPVEPPVEIREIETASGREPARPPADDGRGSAASSPALAAVRGLGTHRPPRDAVVDAESDRTAGERRDADGGSDSPTDRRDGGSDAAPADAVDEWFAAVAERVDRAERLTDADLATATAVVEEADGLDEVSDLARRIAADAERLRAVSDRAAALAARADAADVPIEAMERLA